MHRNRSWIHGCPRTRSIYSRRMVRLICFALVFLIGSTVDAASSFQEVNAAFGAPVLADDSLWDDEPAAIAERLGLPPESQTPSSSSYRLYTAPELKVLGTHPFSIALMATEGRPAQLSFVFTNSGDFGNVSNIRDQLEAAVGKDKTDLRKQLREAESAFPTAFKNDVATLQVALTKLFGAADSGREGVSRSMTEKVQRWAWKGHVFQLALKDNQYVALRILPETESSGTSPLRGSQRRERLQKSVVRRPNGDVVITGIPMVDQGPKGFCVAATLDRCLKYLGIPSDMYALAVAGDTAMGGGASPARMMNATGDLARSFGCRFEKAGSSVKIQSVSRYLDNGQPLIWDMNIVRAFDKNLSERASQRSQTPDPKAWKAVLKQWRKMVGRVKPDLEGAHVCMIIGYNKETDELAISDSWGPEYAERWISVDEAEMISNGRLYTLGW